MTGEILDNADTANSQWAHLLKVRVPNTSKVKQYIQVNQLFSIFQRVLGQEKSLLLQRLPNAQL
jgi:hypothetical protein